MAIAYVQKAWAAGTGSSVTSPSINTTAGNLLIASTGSYGVAVNAPTDNNSETWANAVASYASGGAPGRVREDYVKNCTGKTGHTFTCNLPSSDYPYIAVSEFSGAHTTAPMGQSQTGHGGSVLTTPSVTTTTAGELLHSTINMNGGSSAPTASGSGWTAEQERADGSTEGAGVAYKVAGAADTYTGASWTFSGTSDVNCYTTSYKAASGSTFNETGSGGAVVGGSAAPSVTRSATASGGCTLGGSPTPKVTYTLIASGGCTIGGSPTPKATYTPTPSGGVVIGGAALLDKQTYDETSTGGATIVGSAAPSVRRTATASGGCTIGGSATPSVTRSVTASGGGVLSGACTVAVSYTVTCSGGIVIGGAATIGGLGLAVLATVTVMPALLADMSVQPAMLADTDAFPVVSGV